MALLAPGTLGTLRAVALFSFFYDISVGIAMSIGRGWLIDAFGIPPPSPAINADLNAVFVTVVGVGYLLPYRDPDRYRAYLWLMGPLLKGVGAIVFVLDYLVRDSPRAFLLFAASDGALALLTLVALVQTQNKLAGRAR